MAFILWIIFTICIGILANRYNRSVPIWVIISILASPLVAGMFLLCMGENKE